MVKNGGIMGNGKNKGRANNERRIALNLLNKNFIFIAVHIHNDIQCL